MAAIRSRKEQQHQEAGKPLEIPRKGTTDPCILFALAPRVLTNTSSLAKGHEGTKDTANRMGALLYLEASLKLKCPFIVYHPIRKIARREAK